jgi:hypothetical protein
MDPLSLSTGVLIGIVIGVVGYHFLSKRKEYTDPKKLADDLIKWADWAWDNEHIRPRVEQVMTWVEEQVKKWNKS